MSRLSADAELESEDVVSDSYVVNGPNEKKALTTLS